MKNMTFLLVITSCISLAIMSVSASDYTLDIFGNANMDDTIDGADVAYVEGIIDGTNEETELADANYDGYIDEDDISQIELIIRGEEQELSLIDASDRVVTIKMPVERVASSSVVDSIRTICALNAEDKIVGIPDAISGDSADGYLAISMAYPELTELPIAGSPYYGGPNLEIIASLEPDLILVSYADADVVQEATGIPTISYPSSDEVALALEGFKWLNMMGYVLDRQERAEELTSYFDEKLDEVRDISSNIPDEEKPVVYLAFWGKLTWTPAFYGPVDVAEGKTMAEEGATGPYSSNMWEVSKEQIIKWDPDVILVHAATIDTFSVADILSDPDLKSVDAIQNEAVYYTKGFLFGWDPATGVVECFYMAKIFHPDEFADIDVEMKGNEILKEVYGVDGIWTAMVEKFKLNRI